MEAQQVLEELRLGGIVPVVVIDDEAGAVPLAEALLAGGLCTMEVTFRTAAARGALERIAKECPGMMTGAGTVLTVDQARAAVDAGARYIVSPGLNPRVVEHCLSRGIPVTPGVATPSEIEAAMQLGLTTVKFFPAEANGGVDYLKAISAPYKQMRFIPTGGIDSTNLLRYLKLPCVLACGGSWMVKADLLAAGKFAEVRQLTAQAVQIMLGLQLSHVGINGSGAGEAAGQALLLAELLRMPVRDTGSSLFIGSQFEFLKNTHPGTHGHLAIGTNFLDRAIGCFARQGVQVRPEGREEKNGRLTSVFLDREIGGFALRLVQL